MRHSATARLRFTTSTGLPLRAAFDAGRLSGDGGLVWLAEADRSLGLCARLAGCIPEWRRRPRHALAMLVRQRVFQIACGYADQNDADRLRADPVLKLVCGRLPESGADLASQPTFSRLENAVDRRACEAVAEALVMLYIRERQRTGVPTHLVLDLDGTGDPVHGDQEGSAYHGFYREHMYHPLLIFDGQTGQLITDVLRPGNVHGSRFVVLVLRRLLKRLWAAWPEVSIELRADSGFAVPRLYAWCEGHGITYTIGLIPNRRLTVIAAPLLGQALARSAAEGGAKVRLAGETAYRARTWPAPRRVIYKAEALGKGPNTRFVVTTRAEGPLQVYRSSAVRLWAWSLVDRRPVRHALSGRASARRSAEHEPWASEMYTMVPCAQHRGKGCRSRLRRDRCHAEVLTAVPAVSGRPCTCWRQPHAINGGPGLSCNRRSEEQIGCAWCGSPGARGPRQPGHGLQ
jgi:hypothetical protein